MNRSNGNIPALFVHHRGDLRTGGGGAQICTREYFETLEAAGFALRPLEVETDRTLLTRARRRLSLSPYRKLFNLEVFRTKIEAALSSPVEYVFVNQRYLAPLARIVREVAPRRCKIVMLSHGVRSIDYMHKLRISGTIPFGKTSKLQRLRLAEELVDENKLSRHFDHVFCLSSFEVEIERWLGVRSVSFVPRVVTSSPLDWQPRNDRLGFVGRLDHPPNLEGLMLFLEAIQRISSQGVQVRVVGSPPAAGECIANRFPFVEYLGELSDNELESEASTWSCFLHPLFCYAAGCSTKLAIALGWQIPVVTTTPGHRGYCWQEGRLPVADDPESFARLALEMLNPASASSARIEARKVAQSTPTVSEIADLMRSSLLLDVQCGSRSSLVSL